MLRNFRTRSVNISYSNPKAECVLCFSRLHISILYIGMEPVGKHRHPAVDCALYNNGGSYWLRC
jgi:hypothetical protein